MFFLSTPSLIITFVLVVFYLANLALFVVNRQKEKDSPIEIVGSQPESDQHILIQLKDHSLQSKTHNDTRTGNLHIGHFFAVIAANRDIHRRTLHDIPVIFNPGIDWKLFFRPPPQRRK